MTMQTCYCGSPKSFEICCGPLIAGKSAETAEALMRSRYSAFVLGDLDYIQKTCAGEAALKFNRPQLAISLAGTVWLGLNITDVSAGQADDSDGVVTFEASFREDGRVHTQVERSEFRRVGGEWRYCKGEVSIKSRQAPLAQVGRNDPCPCGSGKKFKKCCG